MQSCSKSFIESPLKVLTLHSSVIIYKIISWHFFICFFIFSMHSYCVNMHWSGAHPRTSCLCGGHSCAQANSPEWCISAPPRPASGCGNSAPKSESALSPGTRLSPHVRTSSLQGATKTMLMLRVIFFLKENLPFKNVLVELNTKICLIKNKPLCTLP